MYSNKQPENRVNEKNSLGENLYVDLTDDAPALHWNL